MAENNNNSNPFGINLANANMKNVSLSLNSNVTRGNVEIKSVYDPRPPPTNDGTLNVTNVLVDINSTKVEGDVKMHDIPIVPAMPVGRGPVRPPLPPVNVGRQAPAIVNPIAPSVPRRPEPVQNPGQSSTISSNKVNVSFSTTRWC